MALFWVLIVLSINGIVSFSAAASSTANSTIPWGMYAVNFVFFLGITQTGIIFSAMMKIARSGWSVYYSRLGEILTLSFIPVAVVTFLIFYFAGGVDHIFYWASAHGGSGGHHSEHISPWLDKDYFLLRYVITQPLFYIAGYLYFRQGRLQERYPDAAERLDRKRYWLAAFTTGFYVIANTNLAWDFAMMIYKHWESSILPPYFWSGNLIAGCAFLFIMSQIFIKRPPHKSIKISYISSMGVVFFGFVLLWTYMFFSQYIVLWYGNLPARTGVLFSQMRGNYSGAFLVMMLAVFVVPFITLIFRQLKRNATVLTILAVVICVGIWINRYLMIMPALNDGSDPSIGTWVGFSLIAAGISLTILSIIIFKKYFPSVTFSPEDSGAETH